MKKYVKSTSLLLATSSLIMFSGCMNSMGSISSIGSSKTEAPIDRTVGSQEEEELMTFEVSDNIADLEKRIEKMKKDNILFFAPNSYASINKNYQYLLKYDKNKKSKIFLKIKEINNFIDNAYNRKDYLNQNMSSVFNHFTILKSLSSDTHYPDRFQDMHEDMIEIINDYDNIGGVFSDNRANIEALKENKELSQDMLLLEIDTVLKTEYSPSKLQLDNMEDNDFDDLAPITFLHTTKKLLEFKTYIRNNHLNTQGVAKKKEEMQFELNHLNHIAKEVSHLISLDNNEITILNQEKTYLRIMKELSSSNNRDKALVEQYKLILKRINKIKLSSKDSTFKKIQEIEALTIEIEALNKTSQSLQEELDKEKSNSKKLNMKIEYARVEMDTLSKKVEELNVNIANQEEEKLNLETKNKEQEQLSADNSNKQLQEANQKLEIANKSIKSLKSKMLKTKRTAKANLKKAKRTAKANLNKEKEKTLTANKEVEKLNLEIKELENSKQDVKVIETKTVEVEVSKG